VFITDFLYWIKREMDLLANKKGVKNNSTPKKKCEGECKKTLALNNFYNTNSAFSGDGKLNICKKCVESMIDYNNIETVYKILQLMDVPFLTNYWTISKEKSPENPWGNYIRMANSKINEFKNKTWKDSKFESNKIGKTQVGTYISDKTLNFEITDEIIDFFGEGYTNEEYRAMWKKYNALKNNYIEKTAMHTEALLNYVRYRVKEELSTAKGLVKDAKDWGQLAKDAATSAKINPSQLSAADLQDGLSTFGQLVRAVEQAIDIIPLLPHFRNKPQDSVDFNLWCYVNYIRDLKGLPLASYEDIYAFYDKRKKEYMKNESINIFEKENEDIENNDSGDENE
jgi:hypothetical protein